MRDMTGILSGLIRFAVSCASLRGAAVRGSIFATSLAASLAVFSFLPAAAQETIGDAKAGKVLYEAQCLSCHGPAGGSVVPTQPILAGQHAEVLETAMREYRDKTRNNAIMAPLAANLSDEDIANVAVYLSEQTPVVAGAADMDLAKSGEKLYRGGILVEGIPACAACHGVAGRGLTPHYPLVSGQYAEYTAAALRDYANGNRPNLVMQAVAQKLSEEQINALAAYISGLAP